MRRLRLLAFCTLTACGSAAGSGSVYESIGTCDAPPAATPIELGRRETTQCDPVDRVGAVIVDSQAMLDAVGTACGHPDQARVLGTVDFTQDEILYVLGHNDAGNVFVSFFVDDGTTRHVGLKSLPAGFQAASTAIVIPRSDHPLVVDSCTSVCTQGCDQAIP